MGSRTKLKQLSDNAQLLRTPAQPPKQRKGGLKVKEAVTLQETNKKENRPEALASGKAKIGVGSLSRNSVTPNPVASLNGHDIELFPKEKFPKHIDSHWILVNFTCFVTYVTKQELLSHKIEIDSRCQSESEYYTYVCKYTGDDTEQITSHPVVTHICVVPAWAKIMKQVDMTKAIRRSTRAHPSDDAPLDYFLALYGNSDRSSSEVLAMVKEMLGSRCREARLFSRGILLSLDSAVILHEVSKIDDISQIEYCGNGKCVPF